MEDSKLSSVQEEEDFDFEGNRDGATFPIHMIAGSLAGLMEHVAIYPVDTIKTHMQTLHRKMGVFETASSLYQQGGVPRFWKGSLLIGSASVPAHALYFSVYEFAKDKLGVNKSGFQFLASAMTGVIATLFHDFILTPADMIKQRIQLSGSNKCLECAKGIIKSEGLSSFYRSLPITLIMNAPYSVTTVMVNENLKKVVQPKRRKFKFLSYFFCAAVAGSVAAAVTCPMDNIKTKLQTQNTVSTCEKIDSMIEKLNKIDPKNTNSGNYSLNTSNTSNFSTVNKTECNTEPKIKYKSILQTMKYIYREDGFFKGFFKGLTPRVISSAPSCAISWGTYEVVKHFLFKNK